MSYEINKTNGEQLTVIGDGQIDTTATDLTLIGKNASIYGEYLNENFVKLLENFSGPNAPTHPVNGQLWFDTSQKRLKVYVAPDETGIKPNPQAPGYFKSTSGTIVSDTQPFNMTPGDIWIDTTNNRLYFYDGESTILVGPRPYEDHVTGFYVEEVAGTDNNNHTVIKSYIMGELFGIFSIEEFTPSLPIDGYPTTEEEFNGNTITVSLPLYPGFNEGLINDFKFRATATRAESFVDPDGTVYTSDDFVKVEGDGSINGTLTITDDNPLILGSVQSNSIEASVSQFQVTSNYAGQEISLVLKNNLGLTPGLYLKPGIGANPNRAGIFTDSPTTNFDVDGSSLITGDLEVGGSLTVGDGATVTGDVGVTGDVVVSGSVTLNELLFAGTGPINLSSNNDLTFEAVGDVVIQTASSEGLISLASLTSLPTKTTAQLASYIAPGTPTGTIAFCSDASPTARPVWFDGTNWQSFSSEPDSNTTYSQSAETTTGGVNLRLTGSDASTDDVKLASGSNVTVTRTDANTITISSADTNTTYGISAETVSGGANLRLTGSDAATDDVKIASGSNVTVTRTDANTITIDATDTVYSVGTGLTLAGTTVNHSNSVTAATISEGGSTRTLTYGGTFNVPSVTYDAQGHVTSTTSVTLTMPTAPSSSTASYDVFNFINGQPLVGEVLMRALAVRVYSLAANFTGCLAVCTTPATVAQVLNIMKNGVTIGTITFSIGSTSGVFAGAVSGVTMNIGDQLQVQMTGASQDVSFADVAITFLGTTTP